MKVTRIGPLIGSLRAMTRTSHVLIALTATIFAAIIWAGSVTAENSEVAERRSAERKTFTDAEIADGFFRIVFGAEFHVSGRVDRIRKYEMPVRVYVDNRAKPDRGKQVASVVDDIRSKIRHLDIAMADSRKEANVTVTLVRDRDIEKTIRRFYGREQAARIVKSLEPQCLSGFRKDDLFRIQHSDVIIVVDAGEFVFQDCIYEELLQALGPINDDDELPFTMFNDEVQMGFFDIYDQYLLNILYDPRIRAGMTKDQVKDLLPQILPDVRAWVSKVNGLKE
ncbi:MAG: DUF2927 domain-containing protein [Pseudorhodoplanes sp.]|uniref:DUF2927 domain-containing protein n=1 Tax=Pseudorhodoplanes sp. TaxID=1934341 RepID=UPI003D098314